MTYLLAISGGCGYPFMEAEAGELTVGDVERLLSVYKDVVRKYTSLCRTVRHISMTKSISPTPISEGRSVLQTLPAETSASTGKRGE